MFVIEFFPPIQRASSLSRAREQMRDSAPGFRFGWTQQVRVARFEIGFAPLFSVDQRERLARQPTRLPSLDCSANSRRGEIESDRECCDHQKRQKEQPPEVSRSTLFGGRQVEIVLSAERM